MKAAPRVTTTGILDTNVGFVEVPRCWNGRTIVASLVNSVCGYTEVCTRPEYIDSAPEHVIELHQAILNRTLEKMKHLRGSAWATVLQERIDVTRTDRRGRHLKRPV